MNNFLAGGVNTGDSINNALFKNSSLDTLFQYSIGGNGSAFIEQFVPKFVGLLFIIGALSFFFMLLWGAVSWILSGGDKAHIESAKGRITSALVGFILLIATFGIVNLIELFFGIDILVIDIGPLIIQ